MPTPPHPILFGRRMKRYPHTTVERWELRYGLAMFALEQNGTWDVEIWIEDDLVLVDGAATQAGALRLIERMRNRLVKSLTPEGR